MECSRSRKTDTCGGRQEEPIWPVAVTFLLVLAWGDDLKPESVSIRGRSRPGSGEVMLTASGLPTSFVRLAN